MGVFAVALWFSTLQPVEGMHPGFLVALVWLILLFPGVFAMVAALALLEWAVPQLTGRVTFFTVWLCGAALTYAFWFTWIPRVFSGRLRMRKGGSAAPGASRTQEVT